MLKFCNIFFAQIFKVIIKYKVERMEKGWWSGLYSKLRLKKKPCEIKILSPTKKKKSLMKGCASY